MGARATHPGDDLDPRDPPELPGQRIALVQARCSPEAKAYLARRVAEGKTKREAFRVLKRYLVRAIWRLWQECLSPAGVEPAYHTA